PRGRGPASGVPAVGVLSAQPLGGVRARGVGQASMIRWITEGLGTASWEELDGAEGVAVVDVRALVDREGNPAALVRAKIEEGAEHLSRGRRVVVCCDYGISRSN